MTLLDLGEVVLGRNLFRDNGDTMFPHWDSAHRYPGLLSDITYLTAHSSVPPTPVFSDPDNWQLLARKEDRVFVLGEDWPSLFSRCTGGKPIQGLPTPFLMPTKPVAVMMPDLNPSASLRELHLQNPNGSADLSCLIKE